MANNSKEIALQRHYVLKNLADGAICHVAPVKSIPLLTHLFTYLFGIIGLAHSCYFQNWVLVKSELESVCSTLMSYEMSQYTRDSEFRSCVSFLFPLAVYVSKIKHL